MNNVEIRLYSNEQKSYPFNSIFQILVRGDEVETRAVNYLCEEITARTEMSPYALLTVLQIYFGYKGQVLSENLELFEKAILDFRFSLNETGTDEMVFWSEEGQLLFGALKALAGQLLPYQVFSNSDLLGSELKAFGLSEINQWIKERIKYSFNSFLSAEKYEIFITILAIIVEYSREEELVTNASMLLDLMMTDIALHTFEGTYCAPQGLCNEHDKKIASRHSLNNIYEHYFKVSKNGINLKAMSAGIVALSKYQVPKAIKKILQVDRPLNFRTSHGLNLEDTRKYFQSFFEYNQGGHYMLAQNARTNPEFIDDLINIINKHRLREHPEFEWIFKYTSPFLSLFSLNSLFSKPYLSNGMALENANIYTYRTRDYLMSSLQQYKPGDFGFREHMWQVTMPNGINIFATHPSLQAFESYGMVQKPSYFVGNHILPHTFQFRNIITCVYQLGGKLGFDEKERLKRSHIFFPKIKFHELHAENKRLFGRIGDSLIAIISKNDLTVNKHDQDDIIQTGNEMYWIIECSDITNEGSFEGFIQRIKGNKVVYEKNRLVYQSNELIDVGYGQSNAVNNELFPVQHERLETPFGKMSRFGSKFKIENSGNSVSFDFDEGTREVVQKENEEEATEE